MATKAQLDAALLRAHSEGNADMKRKIFARIKSGQYDDDVAEPAEQPVSDEGFSAVEMVSNIPSSAMGVGEGIWNAATSPIETAKGVGKAVGGLVQKGSDFVAENVPGGEMLGASPLGAILDTLGVDYREHGDAVIDAISSRYGSVDKALETLEQDPVGVMVDLAGVVSPLAPKAGSAINPINLAANTAKVAAGKSIPKALPKAMYEKVAKFGTTIPEKTRASMIDTALEYGVTPSAKGVKRVESLIGDFNKKIDAMIAHGTDTGQSIPSHLVFKHLKGLKKKKGGMSLSAQKDLGVIDDITGSFAVHMKNMGKDRLTPADLQELKVNTYKAINWDAKRMTGTPVKEDTYKAVAKAAKEGVEETVPGAKATNQKLSELYELQPHLERAANRIENKNVVSINDMPVMAGGSIVGGPVGATVAAVSRILGKDKIMAANAVKLNELMKNANFQQFIKNNPNISKAELLAAIAGREPTESSQQ